MRRPHALFSCSLLVMGLLLMGAAHPYHISITQAEVVRPEKGPPILQVAMKIRPDDLERALEHRSRMRITLERTKEVDQLIVAYLDEVFQVRSPAPDADSKPKPLEPCPEPDGDEINSDGDQVKPPASRPGSKKPERTSIIRWVGKEIDVRDAWLYFEICLPDTGLEGLEFSNRLFFEFEPDQTNTINFKDGDWKPSLRFNRQAAWQTLKRVASATPTPDRSN